MRVAVIAGRTSLLIGDRVVDVQRASGGAITADPSGMFAAWQQMLALADGLDDVRDHPVLDETALQLPMPRPTQAFGIGVNYADHAGEAAMDLPATPMVFPKFVSCIVGPCQPVSVQSDSVDWEAELVVVVGEDCFQVPVEKATSVIAAYTIGQDLSDRTVQFEGGANPQFGLGKSAPGFGPVGPWLVSADEFDADLQVDIRCAVDGNVKQSSNTEQLIFDVPTLVSYLSHRVQLLAGDLVFTGTPAGVGWGRHPKEFLRPGSRIDTTIGGIGTLTTRMVGR